MVLSGEESVLAGDALLAVVRLADQWTSLDGHRKSAGILALDDDRLVRRVEHLHLVQSGVQSVEHQVTVAGSVCGERIRMMRVIAWEKSKTRFTY